MDSSSTASGPKQISKEEPPSTPFGSAMTTSSNDGWLPVFAALGSAMTRSSSNSGGRPVFGDDEGSRSRTRRRPPQPPFGSAMTRSSSFGCLPPSRSRRMSMTPPPSTPFGSAMTRSSSFGCLPPSRDDEGLLNMFKRSSFESHGSPTTRSKNSSNSSLVFLSSFL